MTRRFVLWIWLALGLVCLLAMVGCNGDGEDSSAGECQCTFVHEEEDRGLIITYENQTVEKPANVSVLFKVETADGTPVADLNVANFEIFEDNELISIYESERIIAKQPEQFQSYTLLLLDLSGSIIEADHLDQLKEAAKAFVYNVLLEPGTGSSVETNLAAVYWFDGSEKIHELVPFVTDKEQLVSGIDRLNKNTSTDRSTNLYGAVVSGIDTIKQTVNRSVATVSIGAVVFFTDGKDQAARKSREDAIRAVQNSGEEISIYTIGLGEEINPDVLTEVGKSAFVYADNINDLSARFEDIARLIRQDVNSHYQLEYCSPKRRGSHVLKIQVTYPGSVNAAEESEPSSPAVGILKTCFCAAGFEGGCTLEQ